MISKNNIFQLNCIVHGRVQGVFFRLNCYKKATELGLCGWAKNLASGAVEVIAQGKKSDLLILLEYIKNNPGHSEITSVEETWSEPKKHFSSFHTY